MNILYLTKSFPRPERKYTGIFNYYRYKELVSSGDHITVVRPHHIRENDDLGRFVIRKDYTLQETDGQDIPIHSLNYLITPIFHGYHFYKRPLYRIIQRQNIDLIHVHFATFAYGAYLMKKAYGIPYVITVHGSDIHTAPFKNKKTRERTLKCLEAANHIIFVSNFLLEKARELGYSGEHHSIIPNGIQPKYILDSAKPKNEIPTVGFLGSLIPIKRANLLPEIFYEISQRLEKVRFKIMGDGPLMESIKGALKERGIHEKVSFTGSLYHDEAIKHLTDLDVIIVPSKLEGFGCVVLEANARGVAVIASANGGLPEALGDGGFTVEDGPNMISEFARKTQMIMETPLETDKLIERTRAYAWSEIVKKERAVYQKVLKKLVPHQE